MAELVRRGMNLDKIAEFCKTKLKSVQAWAEGKYVPQGIIRLRLRTIIRLAGIKSEELPKLHPVVQDVADMAAFGLTNFEEVQEKAGYSTIDHACRGLMGHVGVNDERKEIMRDMVQARLTELGAQRNELKTHFKESEPTRVMTVASAHGLSNQEVIIVFGNLVRAIAPLAKYFVSDDCNAEDRRAMREAAGDDLYTLSDDVNSLLSEEARRGRKH